MMEERLARLEAQTAAYREVLIALAAALPDGPGRTAFKAALDGLLTAKDQDEDPGLEPDATFAHERRFAETIRMIVEAADARSDLSGKDGKD